MQVLLRLSLILTARLNKQSAVCLLIVSTCLYLCHHFYFFFFLDFSFFPGLLFPVCISVYYMSLDKVKIFCLSNFLMFKNIFFAVTKYTPYSWISILRVPGYSFPFSSLVVMFLPQWVMSVCTISLVTLSVQLWEPLYGRREMSIKLLSPQFLKQFFNKMCCIFLGFVYYRFSLFLFLYTH